MTNAEGSGGLLHRMGDVVASVSRWFEHWTAIYRRPLSAAHRERPPAKKKSDGSTVDGEKQPNPIKHWRWS